MAEQYRGGPLAARGRARPRAPRSVRRVLAHPDYARERIRLVAREVRALVHADTRPIERMRIAGPVDRLGHDEAQALEYADAELGMALGPLWATWWLDIEADVPPEWEGQPVDLLLVTNSEATLWLDGAPAQGLVTSPQDHRPDARLTDNASAGETLRAQIEIACNGLFGWAELNPAPQIPAPPAPPFALERCALARFDAQAWALAADLDVLVALLDEPGVDPAWAGELLQGLNAFANAWDGIDRATWPRAREILTALLAHRNGTRTHEIAAVGHAHIDTAWLWPLEETYRKCVRTFASQLRLMERYPDYRFACSQAQQYAWIRDREPALYARIKDAVARGQWLPVGGTWIEPDCNLPAGESLVRQFLHGQRFFERELGRRAEVFWNPDVFGYNGQLPQLMRGAGISGFLTQKLSWNRYTAPEHHTFRWAGIDGSSVIAHFPPADTYNAEATVPELRRAAADFKDHERSARSLLVFGWGDGGGGPTAAMLETLARVEDLQGVPRTTIGDPEAFFGELAESEWPEVVGELYLEYHRGTYTTQARTKRASRRAERALHDAELLAAVAGEPAGLEEAWQMLLLNHFHDILPGSSIAEVHARAERDLAEVEAAAGAVRDRLLPSGVVNTIGASRRDVVARGGELVMAEAPACGTGSFVPAEGTAAVTEDRESFTLDNGILRAVLGRDGTLRSLILGGREAMA